MTFLLVSFFVTAQIVYQCTLKMLRIGPRKAAQYLAAVFAGVSRRLCTLSLSLSTFTKSVVVSDAVNMFFVEHGVKVNEQYCQDILICPQMLAAISVCILYCSRTAHWRSKRALQMLQSSVQLSTSFILSCDSPLQPGDELH